MSCNSRIHKEHVMVSSDVNYLVTFIGSSIVFAIH